MAPATHVSAEKMWTKSPIADANGQQKIVSVYAVCDWKIWTSKQYEPQHDNQQNDVPSEDTDQPGHPPSLIRVFTMHSMDSQGPKLSSRGQWRPGSDWADLKLVLSCSGHLLFLSYKFKCVVLPWSNRAKRGRWTGKQGRSWTDCSFKSKNSVNPNQTAVWFWPVTELPHNKTNKMTYAPSKTQISLGICPVWSVSSLSEWRNSGSLATHWGHCKDWSDWADAQADLSLHWAHISFCWFCHKAAQLLSAHLLRICTVLIWAMSWENLSWVFANR